MARYCIIQAGVVANIVAADPALAAANGWIAATATVNIGDTYANGVFTARVVDPAVVAEAARVAAIDTTIAADSTVASLKAMSNAEFDAWWAANVTTLAQASTVIKRIARIVLRRVA